MYKQKKKKQKKKKKKKRKKEKKIEIYNSCEQRLNKLFIVTGDVAALLRSHMNEAGHEWLAGLWEYSSRKKNQRHPVMSS